MKENKIDFIIRPELNPTIYAYEETHPDFKGLLKIGYTNINAEKRVSEQYPIIRPKKTWKILFEDWIKKYSRISKKRLTKHQKI